MYRYTHSTQVWSYIHMYYIICTYLRLRYDEDAYPTPNSRGIIMERCWQGAGCKMSPTFKAFRNFPILPFIYGV